jgi:hypothetical protein
MSLATETLDRIRRQESFESVYTTPATYEWGIMTVHEDALFRDLTHKERLTYADTTGKYHTLSIWKQTWMFVTELKTWVVVGKADTFNLDRSWYPDFVRLDGGYLLDVEYGQLYKVV